MAISHIIFTKGFELAVDEAWSADDLETLADQRFDLTVGSGFTSFPEPVVNLEIQDLSINDLITIRDRFDEVIKHYQNTQECQDGKQPSSN